MWREGPVAPIRAAERGGVEDGSIGGNRTRGRRTASFCRQAHTRTRARDAGFARDPCRRPWPGRQPGPNHGNARVGTQPLRPYVYVRVWWGGEAPQLRNMITASRSRLAATVNSELTRLYWSVGERLRREELGGERATYGAKIVARQGEKLAAEFGRGFEARIPRTPAPARAAGVVIPATHPPITARAAPRASRHPKPRPRAAPRSTRSARATGSPAPIRPRGPGTSPRTAGR
jgi:DUF1016 N-terminal domain